MQPFATDINLLHWEPQLFGDGAAAAVAQLLLSGTGTLAGTTFTISGGSLIDSHISSEYVIALSGSVIGSFPIVAVNSATELILSVLYDDLNPDDAEGSASLSESGSDVGFSIRTFWPQRLTVSEQLVRSAGLEPADASKILNPVVLERPCALGTLQMIYAAMAASAEDPTALLTRAGMYERLYARALRAALVEIDLNGDGTADTRRSLSVVDLRRG